MGIISGMAQAQAAEAQGQANANADLFAAQQDLDKYVFGEVKAGQTSQAMTQKLNDTLANISAVRASTNTEPSSPSGQAIVGRTQALGQQDISRTETSIDLQNQEDLKAEKFHIQASQDAIAAAQATAQADILGGIGSTIGQIGGLIGKFF